MISRNVPLHEWAEVPLHRVVVSAGVQPGGRLQRVGKLSEKARRAAQEPGVVAFAALDDQLSEVPWPDAAPGQPQRVGASSLDGLAAHLADRLGAAAYGPVVPLPDVLRQAGSGRPGPWPRAYDYRADSYRALDWLDERVLNALLAPADPAQQHGDPPLGELRKHANRGYIHILGSASSGKTSWAMNWMRQSIGEVPRGQLPTLAGWYFARRQGQGTDKHGSELHALQNLISLARRQRDLLPRAPGPSDPAGTPLTLLSQDEQDAFHAQPDGNRLLLLRQRFLQALNVLAEDRPPSAERPMVFLIDGGDEMWGPGTRFQRWSFPQVLPTLAELPEHVYVVLLSRPGPHMLGFFGKEPLLRYAFTPDDVNRSIEQFLLDLASRWKHRHPNSEAATLLRSRELLANICRASEGAFGYVVLLMREWLADWDDGLDDDPTRHDLDTLRQWCERPEALPEGLYGLRAEEFLALQGLEPHDARRPDSQVNLAEALALIGQLRWPLSRRQLLDLLYPGDALYGQASSVREQLNAQLRRGAVWLAGMGSDDEHEPMRFGHLSLQETALAAWRLQVLGRRLDRQALTLEARVVAEGDRNESTDLSPEALGRRMALAQLHAMMCGALKHLRDPEWARSAKMKRPPLGPDSRPDTAEAYDWVWGPLHALQASALAAKRPERLQPPPWQARGMQAREQLINAPYLQSAIRAQAAHAKKSHTPPDPLALREAYILADQLPGEDPDQTLRHRVEAALLQWHYRIAEETLQVGGMLWNLLGADDNGKAHAQRWKDSIDKPALITTMPGRPSDLMRQIPAKSSAVTPCGNWLVTSDGIGKTEIWDLRDGWHRAVVFLSLPWALGDKFETVAVRDQLRIGGIDTHDSTLLVVAAIGLKQRTGVRVRYSGHEARLNSVSMDAHVVAGESFQWALASGSDDGTVGLLVQEGEELAPNRDPTQPDEPIPGVLLRYGGHDDRVLSVSLSAECRADGTVVRWALASGSSDTTVGLLLRDVEQLLRDRHDARSDEPVRGVLQRYSGHKGRVTSVNLQAERAADGTAARWAVASGSGDGTLGLLLRDADQLVDDLRLHRHSEQIPGALLRYGGHMAGLNSVSLLSESTTGGMGTSWAMASGSDDGTVGLLFRDAAELRRDRECSLSGDPIFGALPLFEGHEHAVRSVCLQAEHTPDGTATRWAIASGSDDCTVGLLLRNAEQVKQDRQCVYRDETITGALLRYAGHSHRLSSVSLRADCRAGSTVVRWVLASGSDGSTVGLILSDAGGAEQSHRRAGQSEAHPGTLMRYAGHERAVTSVSLLADRNADSAGVRWVMASGSLDATVGLLVRDAEDIQLDNQKSRPNQPLEQRLSRYSGHGALVNSVSLKAERNSDGATVRWAVASGSSDKTVGLLLRDAKQLELDRARDCKPIGGALFRYPGRVRMAGPDGLEITRSAAGANVRWAHQGGSDGRTVAKLLRESRQVIDSPFPDERRGLFTWTPADILPSYPRTVRVSFAVQRSSDKMSRVHWLGGDSNAVIVWSLSLANDAATLCTEAVCPLGHSPGFRALDFAEAHDSVHFMIGGAVGNDVALMPLELHTP